MCIAISITCFQVEETQQAILKGNILSYCADSFIKKTVCDYGGRGEYGVNVVLLFNNKKESQSPLQSRINENTVSFPKGLIIFF